MSETPSKTTSDEVDERQLELARKEGDAYRESLEYMVEEVADTGDTKEAGDYIVGFAQEGAEGMYAPAGEGELEWQEPDGENCHLEVAVCDGADRRFVPELTVHATLTAEDGTEVGPTEIPFVWHPGLFHYGKNLELPKSGTYTIDIEIEPPEFKRHDEENGDRYADSVEVRFEDVEIET